MTLTERNTLIVTHISFAERLASIQFRKIPNYVQWDEVKSAAYMGLVDAAVKYDGLRPFKMYASFRIFGEIKDYLRTLYWGGHRKGLKMTSCIPEQVAEPEPDDHDLFDAVAKKLSPLGKNIIHMYYFQNKTMKQIGIQLKLSTSRVCQLLQGNLGALRHDFAVHQYY